MIVSLVVLHSSCCHGYSSRKVIFGFRAFLPFSSHKHSCQDDQTLAFPTFQRNEGFSALRRISRFPALLCCPYSITLDSLVLQRAETS